MSLAPSIYTSRDVDAPILNNGDLTSLIDVLQAVLVTGYGTGGNEKVSLGWESSISPDGSRAAFRPTDVGSNQIWLYLDTVNTGLAGAVLTSGYIQFNGWTANDPDATGAFGITNGRWRLRNSVDNNDQDWLIIGNSRCFYIYIAFTNSTTATTPDTAGIFCYPENDIRGWMISPNFFGDLEPKTDAYNTYLVNDTNTITSSGRPRMYGGIPDARITAVMSTMAANRIGSVNSRLSIQSWSQGGTSPTIHIPGGTEYIVYPDPVHGIPVERCTVKELSSPYTYRGHLPGLYLPFSHIAVQSSVRPFDYLSEFVEGGNTYKIFPGNANSTATVTGRPGAIIFDMTSNWHSNNA